MKNKLLLAAVLAAACVQGQEFKLGGKVADFTLADTQGKRVDFASLKGPATVVMFIATKCPVSNNYNERMKALHNDYTSKGVRFVFLNANSTEPAAEVDAHARQQGFPFAVYKDEGNQVADRFGAQVTPEAFVIDKAGVVRYHGSIDDAQNPARIKVQGLRRALDQVLAGQPVSEPEHKAFGCTIKRAAKAS
jgi:peroxiredoxin